MPVAWPVRRATWPLVLKAKVVALARVWPAPKLMVEAVGIAVPLGRTIRKPGDEGWVTVTLTERARAVAGTPQAPVSVTTRSAPGLEAGPVVRVSRSRQGFRVKNR